MKRILSAALLCVLPLLGPSSHAAEDPFAVLTENLVSGRCEKGTPGADGWFVGDIKVAEDGTITGAERWLLVPNKAWAAQNVNACEIRWNLTGRLDAPGACKACEMSVRITAKADLEASTCPQELLTGRDSHDVSYKGKVGGEAVDFVQQYDVDLDEEGRATVSFAKTGRQIGQGLYLGGRLSWVSPHQCKFW
jgi:hypothetical protein